MTARSVTILLALVATWLLAAGPTIAADTSPAKPAAEAESEVVADLKVDLPEMHDVVRVAREPDGTHRFIVTFNDGRTERLTPEQFAVMIERAAETRVWWHRLFNVTGSFGIVWVAIGLLGQVLFTGRMVVQWLASEKSRQSVVPPVFWWMSLVGASMLLVYFIWRRDIVGFIGQATGFFIYIRNLYFIYGPHRLVTVTDDPAPEPELDGSHP